MKQAKYMTKINFSSIQMYFRRRSKQQQFKIGPFLKKMRAPLGPLSDL